MSQRNLTESEIAALRDQGCRAEDWSRVRVDAEFDRSCIVQTQLSGDVVIGTIKGDVEFPGGVKKPRGIYNCHIHNCAIGNDVYISGVPNLANYEIADRVVIENVGALVVDGETAFGNGTEIEVLNEGGGRPLKIFERLSAQIAYFLVLYRHRTTMVERLEAMIDAYAKSKTSRRGRLGEGCRLLNCGRIRNVNVGPSATITGALRVEEGTVASCPEDPAHVGEGVIAEKFIFLSGSRVTDGAVVTSSFVGQGVRIGRQFSAENSAFFANSEGFHGEACSLFAGPYTTTHHKSTLLIAGLFSFYNAGSGSNQSNHGYKLGPLHQGILERGAKTGSSSYLLWPCRIGAFTAVVGKHYANFDTSDFPFSYINEVEGKSVLTPAMNLFTVGTRRDAGKWPTRDRRKAADKLDLITFTLFNPAIVSRVEQASEILRGLYGDTSREQEYVSYKGIQIKRLMLKTCAKYYELALKVSLGGALVARLAGRGEAVSFDEIRSDLVEAAAASKDRWVDAAGMIAPAESIDAVLRELESGTISDVDTLRWKLKEVHDAYPEEEWGWFATLLERQLGRSLDTVTREDLIQIIADWKDSAVKLNNMILRDAMKEFDQAARIGYGIDGDEEVRTADFEAVRGRYEDNSFVRELNDENEGIAEQADRIIAMLSE